jgi:hypothetical protein
VLANRPKRGSDQAGDPSGEGCGHAGVAGARGGSPWPGRDPATAEPWDTAGGLCATPCVPHRAGSLGPRPLLGPRMVAVRPHGAAPRASVCPALPPAPAARRERGRSHLRGGKPRLGPLRKRGQVYLRTRLLHGARRVLQRTRPRPAAPRRWAEQLKHRRGPQIAAVALAATPARRIWARRARGPESRRAAYYRRSVRGTRGPTAACGDEGGDGTQIRPPRAASDHAPGLERPRRE